MTDARLSAPDAARRRFVMRQMMILVAFGLAVAGASTVIAQAEAGLTRWLAAAVPVVLLGWLGWELYRMVRHDDEMMRARHFRTAAISGVLVLLGATMWGLLEKLLGVPPLWAFLLLPIFALVNGALTVLEERRG